MRTRSAAMPAIALALVAAACANRAATSASPSPTGAASGTAAAASSESTTPSATSTTSPVASASPLIEDGKNFAFIKSVDTSTEPPTVTYDLAYFLTGQAATDAAKAHGDEVPPPNDYYIVNDNPRLRTVALAPGTRIVLLDWNHCCDATFDGSLDAFARAIDSHKEVTVDGRVYKGRVSPYWLVARHGTIVRIEEQFLP